MGSERDNNGRTQPLGSPPSTADTFDEFLQRAAHTGPNPRSAAPLPASGSLIAERYQLQRLLGEGGMGAVFEAVDNFHGISVALKWLCTSVEGNETARQRFLREARYAQRLLHPNIIHVRDVGEHAGHPYLVMDLLHGVSLRERLRTGVMSAQELVEVLGPAMQGLAVAHEAHIVHRDLKPENIFLKNAEPVAHAVILDFGISTLTPEFGPVSMRLTQTGHVLGSPYYMAPEQASSETVDQRSDIYSLGVVLFEALSGHLPFPKSSAAVWQVRQWDEPPQDLAALVPDLPPRISESILRALKPLPEQRHPNMRSFMRSLGVRHIR